MNIIRQHIWFSFFCIASFTLMLTLGTWQLQRMAEKKIFIQAVADQLTSTPRNVNTDQRTDYKNLIPAKATGTLVHEASLFLQGKYFNGKQGFHVITPLKLAGEANYILINRGWIPKDKGETYCTLSENACPEGDITVTGVLRASQDKPLSILPQNDPSRDIFIWRDVPQMITYIEKKLGTQGVTPILLRQTAKEGETHHYPIPLPTQIEIRNDHLEYAITWYSLALVIVVMYIIYIRKKAHESL
jgi:surfeit locus 1 family protein